MRKSDLILAELKQEAASTRNLLSKVPFEHADYKPHEKSMTLKRLAMHVAEITGWYKETLLQDELDFAKDSGVRKEVNSTEELLAYHDDLVEKAEKILLETADEVYDNLWTMRSGEMIFFTMPKGQVVRTWCMNHLYHHRGQLTVYLRLLNIPLPGIYGPTADSEM